MNLLDSRDCKGICKRLSLAGGVSLNRMAEGIDTSRRRDSRRRSHREGRVNYCQRGNNRRTAEEHFNVVLGIGNDCILSDFGASTSRRRNRHEIRNGHINYFVHVGINLPVARRRHETDSLSCVHRTAAAERNDEVAIVIFVDLQARLNDFISRFSVRAVEDNVRNVDFLECVFNFSRVAEFNHKLVGHDKSLCALARDVVAQFRNDIDARNYLCRHHECVTHNNLHSPCKILFFD